MLANNQVQNNNRLSQPQQIRRENKSQFWQPRSSIAITNSQQKIDTSVILVPCLNCEDLIALDQIDKHSRICCTVSKRVMAINKSPQLFDEIDFKITKLKESLVQLINNIKLKEIPLRGITDLIEKKIKFLCRACEIAEAVLYVQNVGEIEERKLTDFEQELKILSESYSGSLGVSLYIERLHSLILQKFSVFQKQKGRTVQGNRTYSNFYKPDERNRSNSKNSQQSIGSSSTTQKEQLKSLINEKKQEYDKIKQMSQMYQQKTQNSQAMINNIMNINVSLKDSSNYQSPVIKQPNYQQFVLQSPYENNINGRPTLITKFSGSQERSQQIDQKSEILTQISSSQQWESEVKGIDYQNEAFNNNSGSSSDQLQRVFYSKCLNAKMKMPSTHPSQKIPVSLLFKEVMTKRLPQTQWDQFIQKALMQPQDYLDMNKVNNKGLKNNLKEISQNQQFKNKLQNL